jgi:nicotinamide riboside transporter PnuC
VNGLDALMWAITAAGAVCLVLEARHRIEMFWACGLLTIGNTMSAAVQLAEGALAGAAVSGGLAMILALLGWRSWNRRKRRRAPRTLGAKSRARIAAMVTRMRERPSRPALRPAGGGAR